MANTSRWRRSGVSVYVRAQDGEVGGVWVYEAETEDDPLGADPGRRRVFSSMYAGLRTNLPRCLASFGRTCCPPPPPALPHSTHTPSLAPHFCALARNPI